MGVPARPSRSHGHEISSEPSSYGPSNWDARSIGGIEGGNRVRNLRAASKCSLRRILIWTRKLTLYCIEMPILCGRVREPPMLGKRNRVMASGLSLENMSATKSGVPSPVQKSPKIDSIVFASPTVTEVKNWSVWVILVHYAESAVVMLTLHYKRCQTETCALL